MALRRDLTYPNRYSSATSAQPQGAFLNRTTPTSNDGSYPEQQWLNDWSALFSSLLVNAGITPNNAVDSVGDSQYFDALMQLISRPNVLINSDLTFANAINQRGVANWGAVALNDYGLDRWKKVDTSTIIQPIEQGNFIPNETYTLSWNNGADSRVIVAPTSGNWENSDLEIPITATGATKLELGKNRTTWSPEQRETLIAKCKRYYIYDFLEGNELIGINGVATSSAYTSMASVSLPDMRITPSVTRLPRISSFPVDSMPVRYVINGSIFRVTVANVFARGNRLYIYASSCSSTQSLPGGATIDPNGANLLFRTSGDSGGVGGAGLIVNLDAEI